MAKTGYLIVVYQDINPSSPTYNQTREDRTQDEAICPSSASAHWIMDTRYCELTERGMLTGYEITVYRDVEPLSSTYNQTREERELNLTDCEADETTPNWQNIGEPFCRQIVYTPGGLMGNDGYMIQQQQDMNEYSETADEIREIETLDLTNCPLPNTEPVWQTISESCHTVMYNGQLVYDGTKDIVRVNTNQYSPSWNDNVPETTNVEDEINCPSTMPIQYRWVTVSGEYMCVDYDKYTKEKKQESDDGGQTWTDVVPLLTRIGTLVEANSEYCGYVPPTPPTPSYDTQYLTFVARGNGDFTFSPINNNIISYSTDNGTTWTTGNSVFVRNGDKVLWKGTMTPTSAGIGRFSTTTNSFDVEGNIMSLLFGDNFIGQTDLTGYNYAFFALFENIPIINANNLSLPATTLAYECYSFMFEGCTSLTTAPSVLPATTLASSCYISMFNGCTSLTTAPQLPATTLAYDCYAYMFQNCTNLTTAPQLPATTLAEGCYIFMFEGCTSLTTAPALPATTLTEFCYENMFMNCESLTTAPELPATTLADSCYRFMLYGCTSLNYIKCLATDISASDCTEMWTAGVSSTGTFVKASSMSSWTTGDYGIPSGWTVNNQ